jgi:signal transduction histidine kinase
VTLKSGAGALPQSPHDEFLELCAISTSGELTGEERKRLHEHLAVCPSCQEAMKQYEAVVGETIPAAGPHPDSDETDPSWSQEQVEAALFRKLTLEGKTEKHRRRPESDLASKGSGRVALSASQATWRNVWTLYAAGILLFAALGVSAYQVGMHRGVEKATVTPSIRPLNLDVPDRQASARAVRDRDVLLVQIAGRDKEITSLRNQLDRQSSETGRMKSAQEQLEAELQTRQAGRQSVLEEQSDLSQKMAAAQAQAQRLHDKLDSLERQSSQDEQSLTSLEAKIHDLTALLHDREATIDQQQELLAHDRDIRELMGARDLYVAEVYDVGGNGETKKPYGRVFYTKGKSLIFYAYDLDQQPGVKNASTFQAWGRRGPDRQQALNLGVFYVDNTSKKRWVLRFDDPTALAQIDAVFVTVEPNGGSHKPSNKPLLFAYLHIDPNHP